MTIERAIEILNENRHIGHSDWEYVALTNTVRCGHVMGRRNAWEVIAIAERYERDEHPPVRLPL